MIKDLSSYLDYLSGKKRLSKIDETISADLEISAFTDKENRENKGQSRTLLFKNVEDYDIPVVTNLFASSPTLSELFSGFPMADMISGMQTSGKVDMIKGAKALLDSKPKIVKGSKYKKLKSLEELPILKVWPKDAGKFITLPQVITKSPKDGTTNVGTYRMQVFDGETTGMHCQSQKGGAIHISEARELDQDLNVAVSIGTDPYNIISAIAPLPHGINEFAFSGVIRGSHTELIDNGKYPAVPANSEIIINGTVSPEERREEGPFGDHTGYYSIPEPMYVFHVKEILAKEKPIYAASIVGFPWNEDAVAGDFLLEYMKPMIKLVNNNITDIYLPPEGIFTNMCFIKVKKRFPGDAKKAMFSLLGLGQLSLTKMIIAFDEDINIRDFGNVIWAISTRVDPERDVQILKGVATDTLDHTANLPAYGSKMIIDATKKSKEEGYNRKWPDVIIPDEEISKEIDKKWKKIN